MSDALRIEGVEGGGVRVAGVLGFEQASAAFARSDELLRAAGRGGALDVSQLQDIDSATLAVLLAWKAAGAARNVPLRLTGTPPDLAALAHLSHAETLLGMA